MKTKLRRNAGSAPSAVATIESMSPSMSPPRMAPGMLPSPPRMMMMNAFSSGCSPIIGSSLKIGAMSAPAAAASAKPIAKARPLTTCTFTPCSAAASLSCSMARMAAPSRVRLMKR